MGNVFGQNVKCFLVCYVLICDWRVPPGVEGEKSLQDPGVLEGIQTNPLCKRPSQSPALKRFLFEHKWLVVCLFICLQRLTKWASSVSTVWEIGRIGKENGRIRHSGKTHARLTDI